jgi:ParB/RepB/Spo0J family partition protein
MSTTVLAQTQAPPPTPLSPGLKPSPPNVIDIALELLSPSKTNPRKTYDEESLNGLAASIREQGVLQAIVARPDPWHKLGEDRSKPNGHYEIVAGERRWRAAKLAGLKFIPVSVKVLSDIDVAEIQLTENEQRKDVEPLDQGHAYRNLVEQLAKKDAARKREDLIDDVAKRIGKSARHVYARMKLTELTPELQKDLAAGWISPSHADELVRLCPKDQKEFASAHLYHFVNEEFERGNEGPKFANSVRYVKDKIAKEYQLDLTKPPFPAEDVSLVPAAGPCSKCINNSINSPLMEGAAKSKATCMDRACFAKKREAFVAIEAAKQKPVAAKPEILRVTPAHELPHSRLKEADKPKTRKEWKTAHKGECANVQPAVVVDSSGLHDQAVGAKLVCANTKCDVHFGAKPDKPASKGSSSARGNGASKSTLSNAEKEAIKQEELEEKAELAGDLALFKAVMGKVGHQTIGPAELRLIGQELVVTCEPTDEGVEAVGQMFGWPCDSKAKYRQLQEWWDKKSSKMALFELVRFLVAALISSSIREEYGQFSRKDLDKFALEYNLDPKGIRKEASDAVLKPATPSAGPKAGVCRYCGCTPAHACVLKHGKGGVPVTTCKWADKSKNICTNPECLKKFKDGAQVRRAATVNSAADGGHPHPTHKTPSSSPKKSTKAATKKPSPKKATKKGGR